MPFWIFNNGQSKQNVLADALIVLSLAKEKASIKM